MTERHLTSLVSSSIQSLWVAGRSRPSSRPRLVCVIMPCITACLLFRIIALALSTDSCWRNSPQTLRIAGPSGAAFSRRFTACLANTSCGTRKYSARVVLPEKLEKLFATYGRHREENRRTHQRYSSRAVGTTSTAMALCPYAAVGQSRYSYRHWRTRRRDRCSRLLAQQF